MTPYLWAALTSALLIAWFMIWWNERVARGSYNEGWRDRSLIAEFEATRGCGENDPRRDDDAAFGDAA